VFGVFRRLCVVTPLLQVFVHLEQRSVIINNILFAVQKKKTIFKIVYNITYYNVQVSNLMSTQIV
jgi:hypothetical protein